MWDSIWQIIGIVTVGSLLGLGIAFLLAMLGELGVPATCPILEGLLIFTGFQIAHSGYVIASVPFLAVICAGRLCGSSSLYQLSSSMGNTIIDKLGKRIRITRERLDLVKHKLGSLAVPSIIVVRFIPGFTIATSITCGISKIGYKHFSAAVVAQVLAWEAIFLAIGILGGKLAKSFNPQSQPIVLVIWISVMVIAGAVIGYFAFRRIKSSD